MAFTDLERQIENRTIIVRRETLAKEYRHDGRPHGRTGLRRRRWIAEFPNGGYMAVGLSREQALGNLMLGAHGRLVCNSLNIYLELS
jgi:hypothetical protein